MFLCREKELKELNHRYQSDEMEFIVIYGRRRVGKTALINEFCKDKPVIYFPALNSNAEDNLEALSKAIHNYRYPDSLDAPVYRSFDTAFAEITKIVRNDRVIFVIDEFPYLANEEKSIPSRLQHLLDQEWKNSKIFLILCGSSMSFMEKEVLGEKSPLFGRRTAQFKIKPLDYYDTAKFHPDLSPEDNALIYGITGGIPHYIRKLNVRDSLREAILENIMNPSSYLFEEPENLLKQELREPAMYNTIITNIANGASRISDIASKSGLDTSACLKYIRVLSELEIIQKIEPVLDKSPRKKIYRIKDFFFRFWYRFIPGNMTAVNFGKMEKFYDSMVGSYLEDYTGLVFEEICKQYMLRRMDDLPFLPKEIGEWWGNHPGLGKEVQLDIVAQAIKPANIAAPDQYIIGSCKYKNEKIGLDELKLIREYASVFTKSNDEIFCMLFSKTGFTPGLYEKQTAEAVQLLSLEELYHNND